MNIVDKLYKLNSGLGVQTYVKKSPLTLEQMENLNLELSEIIKQLREVEKTFK